MCDYIQLAHGRVVSTTATARVGERCIWYARIEIGFLLMKQIAHNWNLPCCQFNDTCIMSPPCIIMYMYMKFNITYFCCAFCSSGAEPGRLKRDKKAREAKKFTSAEDDDEKPPPPAR